MIRRLQNHTFRLILSDDYLTRMAEWRFMLDHLIEADADFDVYGVRVTIVGLYDRELGSVYGLYNKAESTELEQSLNKLLDDFRVMTALERGK